MTDNDFLTAMRITPGDIVPVRAPEDADLISRIIAAVDKEIDEEYSRVATLMKENEYLDTLLIEALRLKREAETDARLTRVTALVVFAVSCIAFSLWGLRG